MQPLLGTRGSARPGHQVVRSPGERSTESSRSARGAPRPTASTPREPAATDGCRSGGVGVRNSDHTLDQTFYVVKPERYQNDDPSRSDRVVLIDEPADEIPALDLGDLIDRSDRGPVLRDR